MAAQWTWKRNQRAWSPYNFPGDYQEKSKTFSFFQGFQVFFRMISKFQEFPWLSRGVATLSWQNIRYSLPLFSRYKATFISLNIYLRIQIKSIPDKNPSNFDSARHVLVVVYSKIAFFSEIKIIKWEDMSNMFFQREICQQNQKCWLNIVVKSLKKKFSWKQFIFYGTAHFIPKKCKLSRS